MPRASAPELLDRVRALPAAALLLQALSADPEQHVFLVGGAVRDLLLGGDPLDLDLAVEGPLESLLARLGGAAEPHDRFTTAIVERDGARYDLAQTRAETYPRPGALPQVRPASIELDLERRDFTVNAIALGLAGPLAGELVCVDHARADLEAGRLEVLHDQSFSDDPTRLWRLARYQARLHFGIGDRTAALAAVAVAAGALDTVSGVRIGNELRLALAEPDPIATLKAASTLGLGWSLDPDLARRALAKLPPDGRPDLLLLAVALLDSEPRQASELLDRLEFNAADRDAIVEAATTSRRLSQRLESASAGSAIGHAVGAAGVATVSLASALGDPARPQRWLTDLRHRALQITGDDLIARGLPEGPAVGRALSAARDALLDDEAPDRERQLEVALKAAR